jgi:hypothetical protein
MDVIIVSMGKGYYIEVVLLPKAVTHRNGQINSAIGSIVLISAIGKVEEQFLAVG